MFKVLAYLLFILAVLWCLVWVAFGVQANPTTPFGGAFAGVLVAGVAGGLSLIFVGGIFLCIHKYLHRDDGRSYDAPRYYAPLPPPSAELPREPRVSNSMFGR